LSHKTFNNSLGVLLLYKGDIARASDCFENALKTNAKNVPALLGKACILFNKGNFEDALKVYKEVLTVNPYSPAHVRLGLALCYYKLGKQELARKCFERVLQLVSPKEVIDNRTQDENSVEALVGLAILELNAEGSAQAKATQIKAAMDMLKRAYEINPHNSMVLNHLANHFFYRQDYKRTQDLALQAYHNTEVPKIRAESCYQIARAYHAKVLIRITNLTD
jgi:RNA polymerase-associated protein CTR9